MTLEIGQWYVSPSGNFEDAWGGFETREEAMQEAIQCQSKHGSLFVGQAAIVSEEVIDTDNQTLTDWYE